MCDKNTVYSIPRKHAMHAGRRSARSDRLKRRNIQPNSLAEDLDYSTHAGYITSRWSVSTCSPSNKYGSSKPGTPQRFDVDTMESSCAYKPRSAGGLTADHAYHSFSLTPAARPHRQHRNQDTTIFTPLILQTTSTLSLTGSPFFSPYCFPSPESDDQVHTIQSRHSSGDAVRTMGAGGRSSGCGGSGSEGDSPEPSGVHPGQGENGGSDAVGGENESDGGKKPSSYTFRRRNAIVEGSEDAPRLDDFPDK
ncbi:hypothetical protein KI688_003735 [Linnemannia hyalina]|uniref:Uncharacterized protein n=1 Tax=Linnemannia hyalina TaxID=64524 RepID=A0A9P8BP99_9FUNG|nr:hypothetical protein KI688_003735 [Linnemannia hyalina]